MTDRHSGYVVILDADIREDDAEEGVLAALRMIRGVADVKPVTADPGPAVIAEMRRDQEWRKVLLGLIQSGPGGRQAGDDERKPGGG